MSPNWPYLLEPQAYKEPFDEIANAWLSPVDTDVQLLEPICVAEERAILDVNPNCPNSPTPQLHSEPSFATAIEYVSPESIFVNEISIKLSFLNVVNVIVLLLLSLWAIFAYLIKQYTLLLLISETSNL